MPDDEIHHWPADRATPDGYEDAGNYPGHHAGRFRMIRPGADAGPRLVSVDDDGVPRAWFVRADSARELTEDQVLQILRDATDALALMHKWRR